MKFKCLICRRNYARPDDYVTCEEMSCTKAWTHYVRLKKKHGDTAEQQLAELGAQVRELKNTQKKYDSLKYYLRIKRYATMCHRNV
jgi:hypothetical protein